MSNPEAKPAAEETKVAVAIKCSVKVQGALYAPNDILKVTPEIARKLISIGAAEAYAPTAAAVPDTDAEAPAPSAKESRRGKGKASFPAEDDGDGDED